jgi:hypothetical protein
MHAEDLRAALNSDPFRSFVVRMSSGRMISVTNPELVVISSTGRSAFAYHDGADGFDIIDMRLVESIEFGSRGRQKRRKSA